MPLHDRHYMQPDYDRGRLPFNLWMPGTYLVMIVLTVCFASQQIAMAYGSLQGLYDLSNYLMLSTEGLRHGYIWQLLSFQFLHGGLTHFLCNMVGLWCFGGPVEARLGRSRFFIVFLVGGVAGGLLQAGLGFVFPNVFGYPVVGASAGICALLAAYAIMDPEATILVMFILPMRAKYLLYFSFIIALFFTIVPSEVGYAHAAHLGGLIFGAAYVRRGMNLLNDLAAWNPLSRKNRSERMVRAATVRPAKSSPPKPKETSELPSGEFITQEVDPILEKISAHGIQSLTDRERRILQAARDKMSKH